MALFFSFFFVFFLLKKILSSAPDPLTRIRCLQDHQSHSDEPGSSIKAFCVFTYNSYIFLFFWLKYSCHRVPGESVHAPLPLPDPPGEVPVSRRALRRAARAPWHQVSVYVIQKGVVSWSQRWGKRERDKEITR